MQSKYREKNINGKRRLFTYENNKHRTFYGKSGKMLLIFSPNQFNSNKNYSIYSKKSVETPLCYNGECHVQPAKNYFTEYFVQEDFCTLTI